MGVAASLLWEDPFGAAGLAVQGTRSQSPSGAAAESSREGDVSIQDGPPAEVTQLTWGRVVSFHPQRKPTPLVTSRVWILHAPDPACSSKAGWRHIAAAHSCKNIPRALLLQTSYPHPDQSIQILGSFPQTAKCLALAGQRWGVLIHMQSHTVAFRDVRYQFLGLVSPAPNPKPGVAK